MAIKPRIPATFSWDQPCFGAAETSVKPYAASESVRELLVLIALSGSAMEKPAELAQATAIAFANVCHDIDRGLIAMDYKPFDPQTLDIPTIDHPNHMQALLYWSSHLGCTLSGLAEAHAQLGSHPRVAAVRAVMQRMGNDGLPGRSHAASTQRPADVAPTIAMFAETQISGGWLAGALA